MLMNNNQTHKIAVVSDSAAAISSEIVESYNIGIAPMTISVNGEIFEDNPERLKDFYNLLENGDSMPSISAPLPRDWVKTFRKSLKNATTIFCITVSHNMSASYDSAKIAADIVMKESPNVEIQVFNSHTAAGSQALIVLKIANLARSGALLDELEEQARFLSSRIRLLAVLDTLKYIYQGGRIPRPVFWFANLIDIKPVMEFSRGKISKIAYLTSRRKAIRRMTMEAIKDLAGEQGHVNIMHADCEDDAIELKKVIDSKTRPLESMISQFHPFMGGHTGPGLIGISYYVD